jgi:hypothetical protein
MKNHNETGEFHPILSSKPRQSITFSNETGESFTPLRERKKKAEPKAQSASKGTIDSFFGRLEFRVAFYYARGVITWASKKITFIVS